MSMKNLVTPVWWLFLFLVLPTCSFAQNYYVDSLAGSDTNPGTTEATPWRTIKRINFQHFEAGDVLLFKRGGEWLDATINVTASNFTISSYGSGELPRLIGSIKVSGWRERGDGSYFVPFPRPPSRKDWTNWEVQLVMEPDYHFYKKVAALQDMKRPGQFFYDKYSQKLYIRPLDPVDSLKSPFYVGRQENVIEINHSRIDDLVVSDLEIDLANRYGIGVWWQGDKMVQGNVRIEGNTFIGNAFSAVCLSGGMNYNRITVRNNVIRMNGAEGIYIGKYAARKALEITGNRIGDPSEDNFGWRGEGPGSAFNGDGVDVKTGNKNVDISDNTIRNVMGTGICNLSGSAIIARNLVHDAILPGPVWPLSSSGIYVDAEDGFGIPKIIGNRIINSHANGIHIRGKFKFHPPAVIENNDIELGPDGLSAQILFTVMNSRNVEIRGNRGKGGAYGLALAASPPYPPVDFDVVGNEFLETSESPFYFAQSGPEDLKGLSLKDNKICAEGTFFIKWQHGGGVQSAQKAKDIFGKDSFQEVACN